MRWQPAPFSRIARVSDLETRFIAYNSLVREYTSETFANGSVPTGMSSVPTMCVASPTSTFVERVVSLYGELGVDARLMKFSDADYTYVDTIFTRPHSQRVGSSQASSPRAQETESFARNGSSVRRRPLYPVPTTRRRRGSGT